MADQIFASSWERGPRWCSSRQGVQTVGAESAPRLKLLSTSRTWLCQNLPAAAIGRAQVTKPLPGMGGRACGSVRARRRAGDFRLAASDALGDGQRARQGEHLAIEEGNAQFQRRRHGHLVRFQEISCCIHVRMFGGLHGGDFIRLDFREGAPQVPKGVGAGAQRAPSSGARRSERLGPWKLVFETDITLGKRVRSAHEEVPPVGAFGPGPSCGGQGAGGAGTVM